MKHVSVSILTLALLSPSQVLADATGAGDAAILAELVSQTQSLADTLKKINETLNVQKQIESMEQLKAVKQLYEEGVALGESLSNIQEGIDAVENTKNTRFGTRNIESDANWLERTAKEANDLGDYSSLAIRVKDLSFVSKANKSTQKKMAAGTNEVDDNKVTATNLSILGKLAIEDREHKLKVEKMNEELLRGFLGGKPHGTK